MLEFEYQVITNLLYSSNPLDIFKKNTKLLCNCRVLLFDNDTNNFKEICTEKKYSNYLISHLAGYKNTMVLDKNTMNNDSIIKFAQCIDFDSNVISNLGRLFFGNYEDYNLYKILRYIKTSKVQSTILPYLIECTENNFSIDKVKIFETMLAFEIFDSNKIDYLDNIYNKKIEISYTDENLQKTDSRYSQVKRTDENMFYLLIYCLLLKTVYLKFTSKKSAKNKIIELFNFVESNSLLYLENEMILFFMLLDNDKKIETFFSKIQIRSKDILEKIKNTAWDLCVVRLVEYDMSNRNYRLDEVFLHSIVSADRGLNEIINLNPIKRIVYYNGKTFTSRNKNMIDYLNDDNTFKSIYSTRQERLSKFECINIKSLIKKCENEIITLTSK